MGPSPSGVVDVDVRRAGTRSALGPVLLRLRSHARRLEGTTPGALCHGNEARRQRMSARAGELSLDVSHNLLDDAALDELLAAASTAGLPAAIHAAYGRRSTGKETHHRSRELALHVRLGRRRGATGAPIRQVVDLCPGGGPGPRMALRALRDRTLGGPAVCLVTDTDAADLHGVLRGLDAASTMFVLHRTTSTARAADAAAATARAWLLDALGHDADVGGHFVVVSDGAAPPRWLGLDDRDLLVLAQADDERGWLTSVAGLSILLALGPEHYDDLLTGLDEMDQHLRTTPWRDNLPVLMALVGLWNRHVLGLPPAVVLSCTEDLGLLPAYVHAREPESVRGHLPDAARAPESELEGPCDVIALTTPIGRSRAAHDELLARCLPVAVTAGPTSQRLAADGRACSTLLAPALSPRVLGQLLAVYEHKRFVQGLLVGSGTHDPGAGPTGPHARVR